VVSVNWWIGFHVFVFLMLAFDLGVINKHEREISIKESLIWTGIWIFLAMIFNAGVFHYLGERAGGEFLTGYVLEKSLSIDNIFVMTVIFGHFKISSKHQHRVLFWGILGALIMRILFISGGVSLIQKFHFVIYIFGAFLAYTGIKMLISDEKEVDPEKDFAYRICKKYFRMTNENHGEKFFIKKNNLYYMTPMFLVLLIIESTDLVFALDSIPATLSVTRSTFIAYTSNIFAILGLRSLYFAFLGVVHLFKYLKYALSVVLIFIGFKMLVSNYYEIPTNISLYIVIGLILSSMIASLIFKDKKD
jgi:tellurite resistance protein TerC